MSIHLRPQDVIQGPGDDIDSASCPSSSGEDEDQNDPKTWDDWASDSQQNRECYSLFEDKKLVSVAKAIEYDEQTHQFNLDRVANKLGERFWLRSGFPWKVQLKSKMPSLALDFHQRIRFINYIRKQVAPLLVFTLTRPCGSRLPQKPSATDLSSLTGVEPFFTDDQYLIPVMEDDPLLREHITNQTHPAITAYLTPFYTRRIPIRGLVR